MNIPNNLLYTKSHEWYEFKDETTAIMGITDYAQNMLGDIVYINLPTIDESIGLGDVIADIESVKTAADVYCAVSGNVCAINDDLTDAPELLNQNSYDAWIAEIMDISEKDDLMSAKEYEEYLTVEELL